MSLRFLQFLILLVAELSYNSVRTGYKGKLTQVITYSKANNTTLKHFNRTPSGTSGIHHKNNDT